MQFSIARLLLITLFVNFVLAATFALPGAMGYLMLTFVSLFVLPPLLVVGVFNTRGLRQSFFLGAMVTGIPHFVFTVYYGLMIASSVVSEDLNIFLDVDETGLGGLEYVHPIGYLLGAIGGSFGMAAFAFLKIGENQKTPTPSMAISNREHDSEQHLEQATTDLEFRSNDAIREFEQGKPGALPPR